MSIPNSLHNTPVNSEHGDDYIQDPNPITRISKLDVSGPLHLHPNDTTALTVVSIKLKGTENYQVWSCAMLLALEGKNKIVLLMEYVKGLIQMRFLIFSKRVKHVWEELKETYDKVDGSIKFGLRHKISTLKQNGLSIADHYHKLNALWKQYDATIELPKCVCNASESFKKHNQMLKLMQFLMGLDNSYMQIRCFILCREVLPNVKSAYATISSEESHRVGAGSIAELDSGSRPNNMNNNRQGGGSDLVCENCGFNGHTIDRCFKIIGYPADFGKKKSNQSFKGKNVSNNNSVLTSSSSGFIDKQMATLISLIKDNKIGKNVQANMVGANQHMTYIDKELDNVFDISHLRIKVGHPNGIEAYIIRLKISENKHDWHYRLGHPAKLVLDVLKDSLQIDKNDNTDSEIKKDDSTNVLQDINHINFFDIKYPEIPNDDERVENYLNKDKKSQSDSISSSVSGSNHNTADFLVDNPGNDADSSGQFVPTQNKGVATFEENVFSEVKYGLEKYVGYSKLNSEIFCFVTQLNKTREPKSYFEASKYPHWNDAMNQEMDALLRNGTWEIVELPEGRKAIGSKWIYKIKFRSSGEIDRYKARLVAQGFGQKEGIDYEETFSPVVKMVTIRCLLNIVVSMSWPVFQLDVNNAFLYGDLEEAPRKWNAKLTSTLIENGFSQSNSDYSLYTKSDKGVFLDLLVYVDDIIITGNFFSEIEKFKVFLKSKFMIKDLGKLKYFLGIEVIDTDKGICLNQRKYVLDLLSWYGMLACKPAKTPLMSKLVISNEASDKDPLLENITDYQKLMGKLLLRYSDISRAVHVWEFILPRLLKSKKQNTLFKSSTEAEYRALASVTSEILKGVVKTVKVDSANQIADILTKGLDTVQNLELVKRIVVDGDLLSD
ncbi:ribonuclease H-like domain-containing protein [Tanacetum coccineum]